MDVPMIISIEGADATGKSSVCRFLCERLEEEGYEVLFLREPGSTGLGEKVRALLLHDESLSLGVRAELFLYLAARAQLIEELIRPAIKQKKIIVLDRYVDSTLVYQGVVGELGVEKVLQVMIDFFGAYFPQLTIVLDSDVDVIMQRLGNKDKIESRGREFLYQVVRAYRDLVEIFPERMVLIDSSKDLNWVCEEVWKTIRERL